MVPKRPLSVRVTRWAGPMSRPMKRSARDGGVAIRQFVVGAGAEATGVKSLPRSIEIQTGKLSNSVHTCLHYATP